MATMTLPDARLTPVPKSRDERLEELNEVMREQSGSPQPSEAKRDLCKRILDEIDKVESEGFRQSALWGSITATGGLKVTGQWNESDSASAPDLIEKVANALQTAVEKWIKRDRFGDQLSAQVASFLLPAKRLEEIGYVDTAIDLINDSVDELFRRGHFAICDAMLAEVNPSDYSTDILLTILTATAPAREMLHARREFFRAAKRAIKARKEYERGLLDGLE